MTMNNDPIAKIWDERNKEGGDPYKKYVLDPLILKLIKPIKDKIVLDQGCGNGHLSKKIAREEPQKIILLDYFSGNLTIAQNNVDISGSFTETIQADLNKVVPVSSSSIEIIVSNMVLSEIRDCKIAIQESYRILKKDGVYVLSVVHPAFTYKMYLKEKYLPGSGAKIVPPRHYFDHKLSSFILGTESHTDKLIKAPHYQRTIEEYHSLLQKAGFVVEKIIEPKLNSVLLKNYPRFKQDQDCPIALIFKARKLR